MDDADLLEKQSNEKHAERRRLLERAKEITKKVWSHYPAELKEVEALQYRAEELRLEGNQLQTAANGLRLMKWTKEREAKMRAEKTQGSKERKGKRRG